MKKIGKGKKLEELVKGSLDYTMQMIRDAFRATFQRNESDDFYIAEIFSDHLIVTEWGNEKPLKTDEYWMVSYSKNGDTYTFAPRDAWEVVELTYQPQTHMVEAKGRKKGHRLEESVIQSVELLETEGENPNGPWKIKGIGITADVVNANGRRYPAPVLEAAVRKLKDHLHESAGQGRLLQPASLTTGESDHPKDKGNRRPLLLETVINWENVTFDGKQIMLEGNLLGTSNGKDIRAIMQGGVKPGISQRAYGDSKVVKEGSLKIEEVTDLEITGFDLTAPNEESDPFAEVTFHESINSQGDEAMNLEDLIKLLKDHPEVLKGITEAQIRQMGAEQLASLEEKIRTSLGIDAKADLAEAIKVMAEKARKFEEGQKQTAIEAALTEATKDLPFGEKLNKQFTESLRDAKPISVEQVKALVESKRKEYGALAAAGLMKGLGFDEKKGTFQVLGDVLENETGTPEFGRAAFEIQESIRKFEMRPAKDLRKNESRAAQFAIQLLERFDKMNKTALMNEARLFQEAEATSDLNLPYSVSRAIIAEAFPQLVAANIFDVGVMSASDERIYFEAFSGETGYTVTITDEVVTGGAEGTWYALAHANVIPGTVTVTSNPAGTGYDEGDDYIIDYELGKIKFLTPGDIGANDVLVDYQYNAIRQGEDAEIERAKVTLSYQLVTASAMRVSDYITDEAIKFSRSQLGWDARARTMASLVNQLRLNIDRNLIEKGLAGALSVASNSGGTFTSATDPWSLLAEYIGYAKVKVGNRYYAPTFILMSDTNADLLSNWDGFTRLGFPNSLLDAAGFAGGVKGLPVFHTPVMRDTWNLIGNRELVMHRVYSPMTLKGPFQTFGSNRKLVAAEQYYAEEYNVSICPIPEKGSVVKMA